MFEKEAKEYVNEEYDFCYYPEDNLSARINAERDWSKGAEFGYNKCNVKLTKAKEIIKDYLTFVKGSHIAVCGVPEENRTIYVLKLNKEAEQFLKESD